MITIVPAGLKDYVSTIINEVYTKSYAIVPISVIILVWSASKFFHALTNGLNVISRVKETRNWFYIRFRSMILVLLLMVGIFLITMMVVFGHNIQKALIAAAPAVNAVLEFFMEEYGQPMHSFDYDTVAGHTIIVRRAEDGEVFTTLDGQKRNMDHDVLMICDAEKEIGIAGIMGGENSMITDSVKNVLFEAACFDGTNIRLSSKRIGLQTDASGKFDKGIDPNVCIEAINRACQLMEEFGAGEVVGGTVDVHGELPQPTVTPFEPEKINALLGTDVDPEEMIRIFEKEGLTYDKEKNAVIAPTWRQDLHRMCDYAEEVARFHGYDKIPTTLPSGEATSGGLQPDMAVNTVVRQVAEGNGFLQGYCYSFESPKVFDKLLIPENCSSRQAIRILNPLGEDFSIMRTLSLNGILTSLATNANRRNKSVRLYEMGNVYIPKQLPLTELPDERMKLTLGMYGDGDFFDLKGVVEMLLIRLGMKGKTEYLTDSPKPFLHPGRQASVVYEGKTIGFLGEVHPQVRKNYEIDERAYVCVMVVPEFSAFS